MDWEPLGFSRGWMSGYKVAKLETHLGNHKLPNIFSLVIYHGKRPYPSLYAREASSCFEIPELAPFKTCDDTLQLVDLRQASDEQLFSAQNVAGLVQGILKYGFDDQLFAKLSAWSSKYKGIFRALKKGKEISIFDYVSQIGETKGQNVEALLGIFEKAFGEEQYKSIMTLAKQLEQQGMQQGMQQGVEQRNVEIAKNMLQQGFEPAVIAQLTGLNLQQIQSLR